MLDLKKEQREQFVKKVTGMAASLEFKVSQYSLVCFKVTVTMAWDCEESRVKSDLWMCFLMCIHSFALLPIDQYVLFFQNYIFCDLFLSLNIILHHVYTCLHTMFCTCYKLFVLSLPCRMLCTQVKMETTWPSAEMSASYRSTY